MNFRPRNKYETFQYRWPGQSPAARVINGESATLVGWIPVYQEGVQLPRGPLQDRWDGDPSIPLLLSTGNHAPPEHVRGPGELDRYLNTLDFRGAISIDQPTLFIDAENRPILLLFLAMSRVGSTAFRPGHLIGGLKSHLIYLEGTSTSGDVSLKDGWVLVRLRLRMNLGLADRVAARVVTGNWPPWAVLMLEYVFDLNGRPFRAHADLCGTAVPSQSRYIGWRKTSEYQIEYDMSEAAYDGFVQAGSCQDAMINRNREHCQLKVLPVPADVTRG